MKPILNIVRNTLLEYLKQNSDFPQDLEILPGDGLDLMEKLPNKAAFRGALTLYVYTPFPLQTVPDITVPTWEKLFLRCALLQSWSHVQHENFLDLAEKISFHISHQHFSTNDWEGCFVLDMHEPWRWQTIENGLALQMQFVTLEFNPIQP